MAYIPGMHLLRPSASVLVLSALVALGAVAPICAATQVTKPMPCCASASHCAAGTTTLARCCRMSPSSPQGQPLPRADAQSGWRLMKTTGAVVGADSIGATLRLAAAALPVPRPARDGTVPIFLLNATLLR
jgi:hypothetical protein